MRIITFYALLFLFSSPSIVLAQKLSFKNSYNLNLFANTKNPTPFLFYGYVNNHIDILPFNTKLKLDIEFNPTVSNYIFRNNVTAIIKPSIEYKIIGDYIDTNLSFGYMSSITAEEELKLWDNTLISHSQARLAKHSFESQNSKDSYKYPINPSTYITEPEALAITLKINSLDESIRFAASYIPNTHKNLYLSKILNKNYESNNYDTCNYKNVLLMNIGYYNEWKTLGYSINLSTKHNLTPLDSMINKIFAINGVLQYFGFALESGLLIQRRNNLDFHKYQDYNNKSIGLSYSIASITTGIKYFIYSNQNEIGTNKLQKFNSTLIEYNLQYQLNRNTYFKIAYTKEDIKKYHIKNNALFLGFSLKN